MICIIVSQVYTRNYLTISLEIMTWKIGHGIHRYHIMSITIFTNSSQETKTKTNTQTKHNTTQHTNNATQHTNNTTHGVEVSCGRLIYVVDLSEFNANSQTYDFVTCWRIFRSISGMGQTDKFCWMQAFDDWIFRIDYYYCCVPQNGYRLTKLIFLTNDWKWCHET